MARVTYGTVTLMLIGSLVAALVRAQDNSWSSRGTTGSTTRAAATKTSGGNQVLLQRFQAASRSAASDYLSESSSSPPVPRLLSPPQATTPLRGTSPESTPTTLVSHELSDGGSLRSVLVRSPAEPSEVVASSVEEISPKPPAPATLQTPPSEPPASIPPSTSGSISHRESAVPPTRGMTADTSGNSTGVSSRRPQHVQMPASPTSRVAARRVSPAMETTESEEPSRTVGTGTIPSLRIDTVGPPSVTLGSEATYRVLVTNLSEAQAEGITATITLPASIQVVSAESVEGLATVDHGSGGGSRVVFNVERLAGRDSASVALQLKPTANENFDLDTQWAVRAPATSAQIEVKQALLEMEVTGPDELVYGDTDVYSIVLSNPGNGDAKNVSIQVAMGDDTSDTLVVGTVPAGSRKSFDVEITARQVGSLQVAATATGDNDVTSEANRAITIRRGKIQLDAQGPGLQYAGTTSSYAVRVANTGDATARSVKASLQLPEGVKYVRGIDNARQEGDQLVWTVGDLAPGAEQTHQFQCELMTDGEKLLRFAAASSGGLSGNREVMTRVKAIADLTLAVNDPKGPLPVGKDVKYEIQITNRGTQAASQVNVVGQFSEGIEPVSTEGMAATIGSGQVAFEPIGKINPGDTIELTVTARADKGGNHVFRASVQCEDPETRLVAEDTTRFYGSDVVGQSDPAPVAAGIESARSPAPAPNFGNGSWR